MKNFLTILTCLIIGGLLINACQPPVAPPAPVLPEISVEYDSINKSLKFDFIDLSGYDLLGIGCGYYICDLSPICSNSSNPVYDEPLDKIFVASDTATIIDLSSEDIFWPRQYTNLEPYVELEPDPENRDLVGQGTVEIYFPKISILN